MSVFKVLRDFFLRKLSRKNKSTELTNTRLGAAVHRDLGLRVERIRLPSGGEVVIVERVADDAMPIVDEAEAEQPAEHPQAIDAGALEVGVVK